MTQSDRKPQMDPTLRESFQKLAFPAITSITPEILKMMRAATATPPSYINDLKDRGISHREVRIPSQDSTGHEIILSILQPSSISTTSRPCLYWIHGGGFHWGDRLHTLEFPTEVVLACNAVCISVEYRLAPEYAFSTGVEDCYTGLQWVSDHNEELAIDPKRVMVGGTSAGGGLTASVVLLCRDRQGPAVCAQCLICPALDDSLVTLSSRQYVESSDFLPRATFEDVWNSALRKLGDTPDVAITVPGKRDDLSGLPATYIDAGSAEVVRDETVMFASKLLANSVQTELHIWAGGFHGFDMFFPEVAVSRASRQARLTWVERIFAIPKLS